MWPHQCRFDSFLPPVISYVIQNYSKVYLLPIFTPRIKNIFFLRNVELIFWLTHNNLFTVKYSQLLNFYKVPQLLYKIAPKLYSTHMYNWFKKLYLRNVSYFVTNLYKSEIFWFFQTLIHHFEIDQTPVYKLTPPVNLLSVQYYTPVTTSNIVFNDRRYMSVFMYFLLHTLDIYHSFTNLHQTHFNFLLINHQFRLFKYVNRYLFKVFNF